MWRLHYVGHKISFCSDVSVPFCPKQNCQIKKNLLKFSNLDPSLASNAYLRLKIDWFSQQRYILW